MLVYTRIRYNALTAAKLTGTSPKLGVNGFSNSIIDICCKKTFYYVSLRHSRDVREWPQGKHKKPRKKTSTNSLKRSRLKMTSGAN